GLGGTRRGARARDTRRPPRRRRSAGGVPHPLRLNVRVYVTGASGFVGSHVAEALRCAGAEVHDEWIDLLDRERLRRAIRGCDAVLHVAALYSYDASEADLERV